MNFANIINQEYYDYKCFKIREFLYTVASYWRFYDFQKGASFHLFIHKWDDNSMIIDICKRYLLWSVIMNNDKYH